MMLATVGAVNSLAKARHLAFCGHKVFPCPIQLIFQGFHDVVDQYLGGMLSVVNPYRLGIRLCLIRLCQFLTDRRPDGEKSGQGRGKAATQYEIHNLAEFHPLLCL